MSLRLTRPLLLALLGLALAASAPAPADAAAGDVALDVPTRYLAHYQTAGQRFGIPWQLLAGLGKMETDHGRVRLPGVHSGVNRAGCCAGPMQFSVVSSAPTWQLYRVDGNRDGRSSVYDPGDAIPSAAKMLAGSEAPLPRQRRARARRLQRRTGKRAAIPGRAAVRRDAELRAARNALRADARLPRALITAAHHVSPPRRG